MAKIKLKNVKLSVKIIKNKLLSNNEKIHLFGSN